MNIYENKEHLDSKVVLSRTKERKEYRNQGGRDKTGENVEAIRYKETLRVKMSQLTLPYAQSVAGWYKYQTLLNFQFFHGTPVPT